jgi:hypothetical protein
MSFGLHPGPALKNWYIALFTGVMYRGVRRTPLYFTLPYFTQLKNAIAGDRKGGMTGAGVELSHVS